jgi:fatty acid-binding protein DegV
VWIGVSHGGVPDDAQRLADKLRDVYDVELCLVEPITPSVYLHAGPGGLGACIFPLRGLPWVPSPEP